MLKKIAIAIWILTAVFLGILCLNYYGNKKLIDKYGQGVYQQNELGFLGFTQPYINHFNRGNVYYQLRDYKKAQLEYQYALNLMPQDPYDCKIRVNYALSYVTPIDVNEITEDNYEDVIEICEQAKAILAEKGCATEDNDGHYYAAQKLYNEINEFIESLKNQFENPPPEEDDPNNTATPTPTPPQGSPKPDADHTDTPTPTPESGTDTPTPTPGGDGGTDTPTPTPGGGTDTPTPTPGGEGTDTPTPTPGGDGGETPTPTPGGEGTGTPTPTPGGDGGTGTPTPTPGGDGGTGTPTPTPGGDGGDGTPTPTPGDGDTGEGTPTPTPSPEDRIRDVQDRANRDRYGGSGDDSGYGGEWNFGDSASW